MDYVTLSNGVKMPILGYGVYQVTKDECERCVLDALKVGYRSIDTTQSYFNEEEVGNAIIKSGVPREEIFLTTKVWRLIHLISRTWLRNGWISMIFRWKRMEENFHVFDFVLSKEDMAEIAKLDKAESSFFSHQDPAIVE